MKRGENRRESDGPPVVHPYSRRGGGPYEGRRPRRRGVALKRDPAWAKPYIGKTRRGQERRCREKCRAECSVSGKIRGGTHHKVCGGWRETTQVFVETLERGGVTAHKDRRKPGVEWRSAGREDKNSSRILLTENGARTILPLRQQLPSQRTFQRFSPIRTPEKQSARSTGVRTTRKRDEFVRNGSGSHSL